MSSTVITTTFVISNQNVKAWVPETASAEGRHFVRINKWDRPFVKYCTGAGLQLCTKQLRQSINVAFIEQLQRLRTEAADAAVKEAYKAADHEEDTTNGERKYRVRKARQATLNLHQRCSRLQCQNFNGLKMLLQASSLLSSMGSRTMMYGWSLQQITWSFYGWGCWQVLNQSSLGGNGKEGARKMTIIRWMLSQRPLNFN